MKTSDEKALTEHPKDLLHSYLEGNLPEKDRSTVEAHLAQCRKCADELSSLGGLLDILKTEKDIFCPEPWELFEFTEKAEDPGGKIAQHLEVCPLCRSDVAEYQQTSISKTLPTAIKNELKKVYPKQAQRDISNKSNGFAWAKDRLNAIFRMPTLALGTAVAAILAVILLYPHGTIPTFIGVSSENWEEAIPQPIPKSLFPQTPMRKQIAGSPPQSAREAPKPMLFEAPKPRVAPIIMFHGFDKPLPQSTVDSLYEQLRPRGELEGRFNFSAPAQLKQFVDKVSDRHLSPTDTLSEFYKEEKLDFALIANVKSEKDKFGLKSQLIDTNNGKILAEFIESGLSGADLASKVNDSLDLLNDVKTENREK